MIFMLYSYYILYRFSDDFLAQWGEDRFLSFLRYNLQTFQIIEMSKITVIETRKTLRLMYNVFWKFKNLKILFSVQSWKEESWFQR